MHADYDVARGAGVTLVGGAGLAYASSPGFRRWVTCGKELLL